MLPVFFFFIHIIGRSKAKGHQKINEMLSMKEIHRDSKLYPSCDMAISLN